LAAPWGAWAEGVVASTPPVPSAGAAAVARDGQTLRGSHQQGAPGVQRLSAWSQHVGLTLAPQAVDAKTQAITQVETVRRQRVLAGRVVTRAALLPPRHVAQPLGDNGGADVMIGKDHQPQRRADIALVCALPPVGDRQESAPTVDRGHGRLEPRHITPREVLVGSSAGPGLAQVVEWGRYVMRAKTGQDRAAVVDGGTRLRPERATPTRRLELVRGQWQMENQSHGVRDVPFDDDRSQGRCGHIPHVMAA
jgi:hypothetical protein